MAKAKGPVPRGHHTVTPQLACDNAAKAIDWYKQALGAEEVARASGPDGKIMHAEVKIGDSLIMLNDVMGPGAKGPKAYGGSPAHLWVYVPDCDALFNRAVAAGARVQDGPMGKMQDQFWGDRAGILQGPGGIPVDDRHAQGGFHAAGNEAAAGRVDEDRWPHSRHTARWKKGTIHFVPGVSSNTSFALE